MCTEKACTPAHKARFMHACMHASTLAHLHVHAQNTCTFAHISTMHACTLAHMHAGVHTQNTGTYVHKAPCRYAHPCAHSHTDPGRALSIFQPQESCRVEG